MIRMLMVEDIEMMKDALVRSLGVLPDIEIVETLSSSARAAQLCKTLKPDLVLMDICTADNASGIDAAEEIKAACPAVKVVLMTAFQDMTFDKRAKDAGTDSFIYKDIGTAELVDVIRRTMAGERIFPARRTNRSFENCDVDLTEREIEVLRLLCKGKANLEIAEELFISENTVATHINNLRIKTGISKKSKLVTFAIERGYIVPGI